jgi:hypothetical protein
VVTAAATAGLAICSRGRTLHLLERTLEASSQLAVRWVLVLVFALALLAYRIGLDLLLGGFAAGVIVREVLRDRELAGLDSKLTAVAFGVFIPFFFVASGMGLDISGFMTGLGPAAHGPVPDPDVGRAWHAGAPPVPPRAGPATSSGAGAAQLRPASSRAGHHDAGKVDRPHGHVGGHRPGGAAILSTVTFPLLGLRLRRTTPRAVTVEPQAQSA